MLTIIVTDLEVNKDFELVEYNKRGDKCIIYSKEYGHCSQIRSKLKLKNK